MKYPDACDPWSSAGTGERGAPAPVRAQGLELVRVRPASPQSPDDVAALAGLRFTWRGDERGEAGDRVAFTATLGSWWHEHAVTHLAWLAERAGEPVGMVWLAVVHRVPGPQHFVRLAGIIQSAYVLPAERDAGTGTRLLSVVVDHARRDGLDYLMVHPSERSYAFYRRAGFGDTGRALELRLTGPRLPPGTT